MSDPSGNLQRLNLLVVDADTSVREACRDVAAGIGLATRLVETAEAARHAMATADVHLVLMDLRIPQGGHALLLELRELRPDAVVVIASFGTSIPYAVEAMRFGAYDFVSKPFHLEELRTALTRAAQQWRSAHETQRLRERMALRRGTQGAGLEMVGDSPAMERLYSIMERVAGSASPALISGESGVGKELAARVMHSASSQAAGPFMVVDCAAIPPSRMEAELFGRESAPGLLTQAEGGTVFFDEIGELPLEIQGMLVRAMQDREVRPVGGREKAPFDARILAATQRDLDHASSGARGSFRRDLYFRLNVVSVKVPPLRERREDIPLQAEYFLRRRAGGAQLKLTDAVIETLMNYDWPGNVRELETCMERAAQTTPGEFISQFQILTGVRTARELAAAAFARERAREDIGILPLATVERRTILEALEKLGGDVLEAAKHLGIGKTTLYRKIRSYGV